MKGLILTSNCAACVEFGSVLVLLVPKEATQNVT